MKRSTKWECPMPIYETRCNCGVRTKWFAFDDPQRDIWLRSRCPVCNKPRRRVFGFQAKLWRPYVARHGNTAIEITSESMNREWYKQLSERQTERTGIPHDYQPIDPWEIGPKTSESLQPTIKRLEQTDRDSPHLANLKRIARRLDGA